MTEIENHPTNKPRRPDYAVIALLTVFYSYSSSSTGLPSITKKFGACWCVKIHMISIIVALHNYHDEHGSFPPAYVSDESGRPLYSWRVLILPYLDDPLAIH